MEIFGNAMNAQNPQVFIHYDLAGAISGSYRACAETSSSWERMKDADLQNMIEPESAAPVKTVLLVDDEASVRLVARRMLEKAGFDVITAKNGLEAVSVFRDHANEIDCVLMDCVMPILNGQEALRQMRWLREDAAVILVSGHSPNAVLCGDDAKPDAFLRKPFSIAQLREAIFSVLGKSRSVNSCLPCGLEATA